MPVCSEPPIEWYDFFLYGVVAGIVFNKLFFPTTDPFIGTILAYSTFAIGYLAVPSAGSFSATSATSSDVRACWC